MEHVEDFHGTCKKKALRDSWNPVEIFPSGIFMVPKEKMLNGAPQGSNKAPGRYEKLEKKSVPRRA